MGAIGIIVTTYIGNKAGILRQFLTNCIEGVVAYWGDGEKHEEIKIRPLEISKEDADYLSSILGDNSNVTVRMSEGILVQDLTRCKENNPWKKVYEGGNWLAFSIVYGTINCIGVIWGTIRFARLQMKGCGSIELPAFILGFEIIACFRS